MKVLSFLLTILFTVNVWAIDYNMAPDLPKKSVVTKRNAPIPKSVEKPKLQPVPVVAYLNTYNKYGQLVKREPLYQGDPRLQRQAAPVYQAPARTYVPQYEPFFGYPIFNAPGYSTARSAAASCLPGGS